MPMSQGIAGGGVPGLVLKAWVLFNGTNGAIVSQYNVSGVVRTAVGSYTVTFAVPMASAQYVTKVESSNAPPNSNNWVITGLPTAANVNVFSYLSGSSSDHQGIYVAVYA